MSQPEYIDHHSPTVPPSRPKRGRRTVPVLAGLGVFAVVGAGLASVQLGVFGATGPQPDEFVPSNAFVYTAVDLNPSAKEKVDAYRFLSKFDELDVTDADTLKSRLSKELGEDASWVGDRVAVAAIPNPDSESGVTPFVVAQFEDEAAMRKTLDGASADKGTAYKVLDDGFAIIAETDAEVQAIAKALEAGSLADDPGYSDDVDELSSDRFGTIWVDVEDLGSVAANAAASTGEVTGLEGLTEASGSIVAALEFSSDSVQLTGTSTVRAEGVKVPVGGPTRKIADLPADTDVAVSVTGLGDSLSSVWSTVLANDVLGIAEGAEGMGLELPADLVAVFGTDFAIGAELPESGYEPDGVTAAASTDGAARVEEIADILGAAEAGVVVTATDDGYKATWGAPSDGSLTETDAYQRAVEGDPAAVLFVNIAGLRDLDGIVEGLDAEEKEFLDTVESVSAFTTLDGDKQDFTFRVVAP